MWRSGIFAALFFVCASAADATTYYYVGNPYTTNSIRADFGSNMTGAVTFDFDTSAFSGALTLGGGHITDLQLTSGIYSVTAGAFPLPALVTFTLTGGAVTAWDTGTSGTNPILETFSSASSSLDGIFVAMSGNPGIKALVNTHGIWTIGDSPAPPPPNDPLPRLTSQPPSGGGPVGVPFAPVGQGLPGLIAAFGALAAWIKGRRRVMG